MKNKRTMMFVAIAVAATMLIATAFAGTTDNQGYEAFKEVLRNHQDDTCESGTVSGEITIVDNGQSVVQLAGVFSGDKASESINGKITITSDQIEKELFVHGFDQTLYIEDADSNDVYVAQDEEDSAWECDAEDNEDHSFSNEEEAVLDYFVGDLAKEFKVTKLENGMSLIALELTKSEMPPIVNILASMDDEDRHGKGEHKDDMMELMTTGEYPLFDELCAVEFEKTELVENIEVEYINLGIKVDAAQEIKGLVFEITTSGNAEDGSEHTLTHRGDLVFEEGLSAQVSKLDLSDKNIIVLPDFHEAE